MKHPTPVPSSLFPFPCSLFPVPSSLFPVPSPRKGFTLIEMLVVIGIIGILIAVVLTSFGGATESARAAKCVTNLKSLAQAANNYKMSNPSGNYPLAGSVEGTRKLNFSEGPGWLSWLSRKKYNSPRSVWEEGSASSHQSVEYCPFTGVPDFEDRRWVMEHGKLWSACGRNADIFVCPTHKKKCQEWGLGDPFFSYVMNARFGFDWTKRQGTVDKYVDAGKYGINSLQRADRTLMFADIHMADDMRGGKLGTAESDPRIDQVLTYKASVSGKEFPNEKDECYSFWDGQPEQIGFTHKGSDGRYRAHVVFADGHVEKLVEPGDKSGLDVYQLTALLCEGIDFAATGSDYTTISKAEDMQGK